MVMKSLRKAEYIIQVWRTALIPETVTDFLHAPLERSGGIYMEFLEFNICPSIKGDICAISCRNLQRFTKREGTKWLDLDIGECFFHPCSPHHSHLSP
ncbi:unnamed protein product [Merluccius merluccius]